MSGPLDDPDGVLVAEDGTIMKYKTADDGDLLVLVTFGEPS